MTEHPDLAMAAAPTRLSDPEGLAAALAAGRSAEELARAFPASSLPWALLAQQAAARGESVPAYAYARTGYHRGLDALRRAGWRGFGPVPWEHEPNRGFLRCVAALARAATEIGEVAEAQRCQALLAECDPVAVRALVTPGPTGGAGN